MTIILHIEFYKMFKGRKKTHLLKYYWICDSICEHQNN